MAQINFSVSLGPVAMEQDGRVGSETSATSCDHREADVSN